MKKVFCDCCGSNKNVNSVKYYATAVNIQIGDSEYHDNIAVCVEFARATSTWGLSIYRFLKGMASPIDMCELCARKAVKSALEKKLKEFEKDDLK